MLSVLDVSVWRTGGDANVNGDDDGVPKMQEVTKKSPYWRWQLL